MAKLENFQFRDSGWAIYEILHLKINIKINPTLMSEFQLLLTHPHLSKIKKQS